MKNTLKVLILLAVVGGLVYALFPKGEDVAQQLDRARTEQAKQVTAVKPASQDSVIDLSAQNTKIDFACAKTLAAKTLTMRGGWSGAFNSQLTGQMVIGPEKQEILQIALQIDVGSLWSEHDQLTEALLTKGFFNVIEHPQAKFVSTRIEVGAPDNSSQQGATHQIEGNLTLNGIEKSISFPAKIERVDSQLQLYSQFSLNRKDFQVSFTDTAGFGLLTDENISPLVALDITINATADGASTIATEESGHSSEPSANEAIGVSKLSATYTETIPATQVSFEMVLAPGDAERGIPPIYIGKHEVSWDEFMPWVVGRDLENPDAMGELRAMKLRPSQPYGSVDRGFGMDRRPALGMSRLSAELYCHWLGEQTGKTYRLPTEQEWEHVYHSGEGDLNQPPADEEAQRHSVYTENSWDDDIEDWATKPVGSTEPNALGIYDLAGNVCEWVTETGEQRVARGGHFDSDREELGVGRHIEVPDWNRDYPNEPKSIWWFVNARWVGFRVVREVPGR